MSGAVKSGLIFALVGLVCGVAFSFIRIGGPLWGIPTAAIIGIVAGYCGVRWSAGSARVGQGVLAGTIAGVGALIASIIAWLITFERIQSMPGFQELLQERLRQQQPNAQFTPEQVNAIVGVIGPILGFCFGVFYLLVSLALGALGGWLATRNRTPTMNPPPMPTPPMGPPPLEPPS